MESQPTIIVPETTPQVPSEGIVGVKVTPESGSDRPAMDFHEIMSRMTKNLDQSLPGAPQIPEKAKEEVSSTTEGVGSQRPDIDMNKIMADVMKNFGNLPRNSPPIPEKAKEKTSPEKPDIFKLVIQYLPTLIGLFSNLSSNRPERGENVGPTWKSRGKKPNSHHSLIFQIIVGKLSFIITREKKDVYKVSFAKDGVFHKKKLTGSELYRLIRTVTKAREENVHFALIFKDTIDNRTLEPVDINKKTIKATLEYFLCLL
jgi:hypothetical protein